MKKLLLISLIGLTLVSCGGNTGGQLVGVPIPTWRQTTPIGMVFVRGGAFIMGPNDQDAAWANSSQSKTVSVDPFWMDETEITNNEYKQFVYWVRDSVVREKLADPAFGGDDEFKFTEDRDGNPLEPPRLNTRRRIPWKRPNEEQQLAINEMFFTGPDIIDDHRQSRGMVVYNYQYFWVDYQQAALRVNRFDPNTGSYNRSRPAFIAPQDSAKYLLRKDTAYYDQNGHIVNRTMYRELRFRSDFISSRIVNIYPDTLCWVRDFTYSFNEPYMKNYFAHPGYSHYPVVGVSWEQATAFAHWRTQLERNFNIMRDGYSVPEEYRLPTEAQWEYAARGGRMLAMYPWGGNYIRAARGCYLANFKPLRGDYSADGHMITAKVGSFPPNDFGLYDMAGNVAEWTRTAYHESNYSFVNDLNPNYEYNAKSTDPDVMRRKVIRGGSWKDIGYFLQNGVRTYEYQQEARSYIGFRCVRDYVSPN